MRTSIFFLFLVIGGLCNQGFGQMKANLIADNYRQSTNGNSDHYVYGQVSSPSINLSDVQKKQLGTVLILYSGAALLTDLIVFSSVISGQGEFTMDGLLFAGFLAVSGIAAIPLAIRLYKSAYNSIATIRSLPNNYRTKCLYFGVVDHGIGFSYIF